MINKIIKADIETITNSDLDYSVFKNQVVLLTGSTGMLGQYIKLVLEHVGASVVDCKNINTETLVNYIIHAASPASSELFNKPVDVFACNVIKTYNLLEHFGKQEHFKGFMFLSSGEALHPSDCYGEAKRATEKLLEYFYEQYNVPVYAVRLDHTFGPSMRLDKDNRVFSEFVRNILENKAPVAKHHGETRTFTYITDAMDGLFRALLKGEPGHTYNISNPENSVSIGYLAHILSIMYNLKKDESYLLTGGKVGFETKKPLDITRTERLGYNPKVSVIEGFERTVNSFMEE